ncbi:MAG: pitrilysin family protein [Hyphomicrobiaceae bacterium]
MQYVLSPVSALRRLKRLALFAAAALVAITTPALALPKVQKVVSPGGIEAWLMELNDAPLITFRLAFDGGQLLDPAGKYGTTAMAAYMFDEGAGPYDSFELKTRLTRIAANLGASSSTEYMYVSFSTPSAYKDEAFELLGLALNAPRFDAEPIARAHAHYLNSVEGQLRSPFYIASQTLRRGLYGKHPLAIDMASMKRGYQSIGVDDIKAQRARLLVREGLKIAVVGNIDAPTLAPLLDKLLGGLPAKASVAPTPEPEPGAASCQVTAMDVPQAIVQFGSVTPRLSFRQRIAWALLHTILGEGISAGRLNRELREKRGLIYSIGIDYSEFTTFGVFTGSFGAKMTDVPEALAIVRRELRRIVDEGPTEQEVAAVKPTQVGRTLLGLDTGAAIANLLLGVQINKQPLTYLDDIGGSIESITRGEAWEVAKLLLNPDRLVVSVVGQPGQAKVCDVPVARK